MAETNIFIDVGNESTYLILPAVIICILEMVSNILLLVAFIKDPLKCFRNSGTYLMMNLSVADCLTCPFFMFFLSRPTTDFHAIHQFFMFLFPNISFVSIMSVSIDRFLLVAYPMRHRILMKGKVLILWIAAIWIVSSVIPLSRLFSDGRATIDTFGILTFNMIYIILSSVMYSFTYYKLKKKSRSNHIALQNSNESRA